MRTPDIKSIHLSFVSFNSWRSCSCGLGAGNQCFQIIGQRGRKAGSGQRSFKTLLLDGFVDALRTGANIRAAPIGSARRIGGDAAALFFRRANDAQQRFFRRCFAANHAGSQRRMACFHHKGSNIRRLPQVPPQTQQAERHRHLPPGHAHPGSRRTPCHRSP